MGFDEFKEQLTSDLKERFGEELKFDFRTVNKVNESYEAITITPVDSNVGMNLNVDRFYHEHERGVVFHELVDKAAEIVRKALDNIPRVDAQSLMDYEQMKDKLVMEVVSAENNRDILERIPHKNMEDMAVVYRFMIDHTTGEQSSVLITNHMIEQMGITAEKLHDDAVRNAPEVKPLIIQGMNEVMAEMMGKDIEELVDMGLASTTGEEVMYVATVQDKTHGAGVLAYQDFMDKAAERAGGDFFILPSSIHELLIVPDDHTKDFKELENMVREVNATQVEPEDKLTDNVYHYDSKDKIFELAEKYVMRQAEKEACIDSGKDDLQDEKKSILSELKAKKEEIANQPRKETDRGVKPKDRETVI